MRINLPTDLLRTFVTIVDTGSMARASEHVFLTQSALSLQMKRLSDLIQQPIFQRYQNATVLTPAGEVLIDYARRVLALNDEAIAKLGGKLVGPVRLGMVQDFADAVLSGVLAQFKRFNPDIHMEIKVANSSDLREMLQSELLDIALYLGGEDDLAAIAMAELTWLGDPALLLQPELPVALMSKPCLFRDAALAMLDEIGRPYFIVMETPSISVLRAAVASGLAVTNRTSAFMGDDVPTFAFGTTSPSKVSYCLATTQSPHPAVERLSELIRSTVEQL